MSYDKTTVHTYDRAAEHFAEMFAGFGPRTADVERGLQLAGSPALARVVELGCGDGRDAEEIVKRVDWYEGIDPSESLLDLARQRKLNVSFVKTDALSYEYPPDLDVVFAFASLLHVDRNELGQVSRKVHSSLREGGIFYVSLKEKAAYGTELQPDAFGFRQFYYYNIPTVLQEAGKGFQPVYADRQLIGKTNWFTLALQKTE